MYRGCTLSPNQRGQSVLSLGESESAVCDQRDMGNRTACHTCADACVFDGVCLLLSCLGCTVMAPQKKALCSEVTFILIILAAFIRDHRKYCSHLNYSYLVCLIRDLRLQSCVVLHFQELLLMWKLEVGGVKGQVQAIKA